MMKRLSCSKRTVKVASLAYVEASVWAVGDETAWDGLWWVH